MVSRGHLFPAQMAITCYRRQTYVHRELVIVSAQPNSEVAEYVADLGDSSIRFVQAEPMSLGELRNACVAASRGALLCTWDDDDLYEPRRLEVQVQALLQAKAGASFLDRVMLWWPDRRLLGISSPRPWENTMMVRREALPLYPAIPFREDTHVVEEIKKQHAITSIDDPELYCYIVNARNTCDLGHFELLFDQCEWIYADYDSELIRLTAKFPIRAYADEMLARSRSKQGEVTHPPHRPPLILCSGEHFGAEDIQADGVHFRNCTFDGTRFTYGGGAFPIFEDCPMNGVDILFLGSAANTVNWLRELRNSGMLPDI